VSAAGRLATETNFTVTFHSVTIHTAGSVVHRGQRYGGGSHCRAVQRTTSLGGSVSVGSRTRPTRAPGQRRQAELSGLVAKQAGATP
jgi:hypothetical protein